MATRMIQRRGTSAEWSSANPVLAAGEIGFETDTQKFKFGDGTTAWADITYFASADQLIDGAPELLDTLNELAAAIGDDENFITTITTDIDGKLSLGGGTMTGTLVLAADPVNPPDAANKQYVDDTVADVNTDLNNFNTALSASITTNSDNITSLQADVTQNTADILVNSTGISSLETAVENFKHVFVSFTVPTSDANNSAEAVQEGDAWYDRSNGQLFIYIDTTGSDDFVWVESGGSNNIADAVLETNGNDFPTSPSNGDTHKGYVYDSSRTAWQIDRTVDLGDNSDVTIADPQADQVIMYNSVNSEFENVAGIRLDVDGQIPTTYSSKVEAAAVTTAVSDALTAIRQSVTTDFDTLEKVEQYLGTTLFTDVPALTIKSDTDWGTDTSTPISGSLNVETGGAEIRVKVGNGSDTYANLDYIPSNADISSAIASAIAPLAPKADPTFSGTVSLPSTTSIGDVSDAEIAHLDGVTSGIQGQLDSLDTLKAPLADPTFTGTVSGVDKTMVGLSNVDNTSDVNKPVSTAQQAALDTKLDLAGGTLTGNLILNADPTQALGAVTKQYADSISEGLHIHASVVALSDSNIDLTGTTPTTVIDGVTLADGDRVIINGQTDSAENGIYVFAATGSVFSRAEDFDTPAEAAGGDFVFVLGGTNYENTGWVKTSDTVATIGTDPINFTQFSGAGSVTGGTNVEVTGTQVAVVDAPVFAGTVDASAAGVAFSDGTQTKAGIPSLTSFAEKTADYQLDTLDHKDNVVEMNMSTAGTFTVPLDATLAWPVGASMDIFATGAGEITIAGEAGVTLNATPGLTLRTQWSSATIMKRGSDNWVVYGDLKA